MLRVILGIAHNNEDDTLSINPAQSHVERKIETWFLTAKCEYQTQPKTMAVSAAQERHLRDAETEEAVFDHQEKHMIRPILAR